MSRLAEQVIDNNSYQLRLKINDTDINKELNMSNLEEEQEIDNQSYEVEKILDFRYKKGKPEYKLKWKNYDDKFNSWVPEGNIDCAELIQEYHSQPIEIIGATRQNGELSFIVEQKDGKYTVIDSSVACKKCPSLAIEYLQRHLYWDAKHLKKSSNKNKLMQIADQALFNLKKVLGHRLGDLENYRPAAVIGCLNTSEGLVYLMQWANCDEYDLIPGHIANEHYTKYVFQYFETRLKWTDEVADTSAVSA